MWLKRKKKIQVQVLSRQAAIEYCQQTHREESVMISISDPNMEYDDAPFVSRENNVRAILPLSFCDADGPGKDVYGRDVDENDLMTDEDARRVVHFVKSNMGRKVFVHCDAGISRSAGVGAAIANYYNGEARQYFESGQYEPNMWCFSKIMMAFLED